jgi:hypothetical protein
MHDEKTWTVLITNRSVAFEQILRKLLQAQGLHFDELRCRPLCACCSRLGFTHTARCLCRTCSPALAVDPRHQSINIATRLPRMTHTLVVLADVLSTASAVSRVELWTPETEARQLREALAPENCKSSVIFEVEACTVSAMPSGKPDPEQLEEWNKAEVPAGKKTLALPGEMRIAEAAPRKPRRSVRVGARVLVKDLTVTDFGLAIMTKMPNTVTNTLVVLGNVLSQKKMTEMSKASVISINVESQQAVVLLDTADFAHNGVRGDAGTRLVVRLTIPLDRIARIPSEAPSGFRVVCISLPFVLGRVCVSLGLPVSLFFSTTSQLLYYYFTTTLLLSLGLPVSLFGRYVRLFVFETQEEQPCRSSKSFFF